MNMPGTLWGHLELLDSRHDTPGRKDQRTQGELRPTASGRLLSPRLEHPTRLHLLSSKDLSPPSRITLRFYF